MGQTGDRLLRKTSPRSIRHHRERTDLRGLPAGDRVAGGAVEFGDEFLAPGHRLRIRFRPGLEFFGIASVGILEIEKMRGEIGGFLSLERDMGHAAVRTPGRRGIEKRHQGGKTRLLAEIRMGDRVRRNLQIRRSMRRMEIRRRRMAGHAALFMIERAAPFGIRMLGHSQVRVLSERTEVGENGVNVRIEEPVDHARHVRSFPPRFRIAEKVSEPVAVDAFREIHEIRPFPRHDNSGAAVTVRAAEFGEKDGTALHGRLVRVESLVADDVRSGAGGNGRQPEEDETGQGGGPAPVAWASSPCTMNQRSETEPATLLFDLPRGMHGQDAHATFRAGIHALARHWSR